MRREGYQYAFKMPAPSYEKQAGLLEFIMSGM